MDPTLDIEIDRTSIAQPVLVVTQGLYRLRGTEDADNALQVETVTWETTAATSPFMHGNVAVGRKKGMSTVNLDLLVCAPDLAQITAGLTELITAFTQWTYTLSLRDPSDNVVRYAWDCWCADYAVGFTRPHHWGKAAPFRVSIPRMPVPVTGPY